VGGIMNRVMSGGNERLQKESRRTSFRKTSHFGLIQGDLSIHSLRSFSRDDRGFIRMSPAYTFSCFAWSGVTPVLVLSFKC
jgi:hypothetical protein